LSVRSLVDPIGPRGCVQVSYLLLAPTAAIVLLWWRRRIGYLRRHRVTTPVRTADVVAILLGAAITSAGLYAVACGLVRGIGLAATGWPRAVDPGPLALGTEEQMIVGGGLLVVGAFVLGIARRKRPVREAPVDTSQVALGRPSPGRVFPAFGRVPRGVFGLLGVLGLADVLGVFVLWIVGVLPADGLWGTDGVVGHLVVVFVATVVFIRAAQAAPPPGADVRALSGVVIVAGRSPFVWLSGVSATTRPTNRVLPGEALTHVHLIRTLGSTSPGTAMVTIHPPGADPFEYPNELHLRRDQASRLRALLPEDKVSELVRAPSAS
jgi:hypothetical protein